MISYAALNQADAVKNAAKISALVAVFHIIFVCLYIFVIGYAHIPTTHVVKSTFDFLPSEKLMSSEELKPFYAQTTIETDYVKIKLGVLNSCTLHLTVIGSILLIFLGGYGLASLPMEFLNSYLNRPQIVANFLKTARCRRFCLDKVCSQRRKREVGDQGTTG